jgi:F420-non-reducing hydrogenase iron-sulfur subunit
MKEILQTVGISSDRLRLEWVSASEANKFGSVVNNFVEQVRELGPNPLKGGP